LFTNPNKEIKKVGLSSRLASPYTLHLALYCCTRPCNRSRSTAGNRK